MHLHHITDPHRARPGDIGIDAEKPVGALGQQSGDRAVQVDAGLRARRHHAADRGSADPQRRVADVQAGTGPAGLRELGGGLLDVDVDEHVGPETACVEPLTVGRQRRQARGAQQMYRAQVDERARRRGEPGQGGDFLDREDRRVRQFVGVGQPEILPDLAGRVGGQRLAQPQAVHGGVGFLGQRRSAGPGGRPPPTAGRRCRCRSCGPGSRPGSRSPRRARCPARRRGRALRRSGRCISAGRGCGARWR